MEDRVLVYTDGGSRGNPGPAAAGMLVYSPEGRLLEHASEYLGHATNNQAEYAALLRALELSQKHTRSEVICHSDSELMVRQLKGEYKVKNPGIQKAVQNIRQAEKAFSKVEYVHLPRTNPRIRLADTMVNRVLDRQDK